MRRKDLLRGLVGEKFHVTPASGPSFTARLWGSTRDELAFHEVFVAEVGAAARGLLIIPRRNVAYVQLLVSDASG